MSSLNVKINASGAKAGARDFNRSVDSMGRNVDSFSKTAPKKMGSAFESIIKHAKLMAVGTVAFFGFAAREFIKVSDEMKNLTGRLGLVTSSYGELIQVQRDLLTVSNEARVSYAGTVDLYAKLARATKEYGTTQETLLSITETISKSLIISGASATEAGAALMQLGQGMASGVLRGEELNSILEQTPRLAQLIAEGMGVTVGQLRKLGAEGLITTERIVTAVQSQGQAIDDEFKRMPMTVAQAFIVIKNEAMALVQWIDELAGIGSKIANWFIDIAQGIATLREEMIEAEAEADKLNKAFEPDPTMFEQWVTTLSRFSWDVYYSLKYLVKAFGSYAITLMRSTWESLEGTAKGIPSLVMMIFYDMAGMKSKSKEMYDEMAKNTEDSAKKQAEIWSDYTKEVGGYYAAMEEEMAHLPELVGTTRLEAVVKLAGSLAKEIRGVGKAAEETSKTVEKHDAHVQAYLTSMKKAATAAATALEKYNTILEMISRDSLPEYERGLYDIEKRYDDLIDAVQEHGDAAGKSFEKIADAVEGLETVREKALENYRQDNIETTDKICDLWQHTYEKMTDILSNFFKTGKFNLSSFVDFFKNQLSQMAAAWVMGDQRGGGFSFANMFGGGGTQPGSSGIQQGIQGASTAWSLNRAYGAYTTAGGGWGGLGAGAGSYFGVGGAGAPAQATWSSVGGFPTATTSAAGGGFSLSSIPVGVWAAAVYAITSFAAGQNVKKGYGRIEGSPDDYATVYQPSGIWSGEDYFNEPLSTYLRGLAGRDEPTATGYQSLAMNEGDWENWFRASLVAAWDPLGITESILGAIGIDLSGIFGYGKSGHRPHAGLTVTGAQWDPLTKGFTYPGEGPYGGREPHPYTDAASEEGLAWVYKQGGSMSSDVAQLLESSLLRITKTWDAVFSNMAELMGEKGDEWLSSLDIAFDFRRIGGRVESEVAIRSIVEDWNEDFYKASIPALTEGMGIIWSGVKDNFENVWDVLDKRWQGILEDAVGVPPILDPEGNIEKEMAKIEDYLTKTADVKEYLGMLSSVMDEISEALEFQDFAPSVGAAVVELRDINEVFVELGTTLVAAGVDLEKYTDLQIAYNFAIEDWINKAFVGAIAYAKTSESWRARAPQTTGLVDQYIEQYQHVQGLYSAYDGTTASAIELSDALGILAGVSYDLADEIHSAIVAIHESYASTLESMYLETLSKQEKYDYYRTQIEGLYADLATETDSAETRKIMEDIRTYSAAGYGMLTKEQKKQYFPDYEAFLLNVETVGIDRLKTIGEALDATNKNLIEELRPLIISAVKDIQDAAQVNLQAANAQVDAADTQQNAADTPIAIEVTCGDGEVG